MTVTFGASGPLDETQDKRFRDRAPHIESRENADYLCIDGVEPRAGDRLYSGTDKFYGDPHWRDHILFYEYFHGDNGAGLGASHQTGWTGLVAKLIQLLGLFDAKKLLHAGESSGFRAWR